MTGGIAAGVIGTCPIGGPGGGGIGAGAPGMCPPPNGAGVGGPGGRGPAPGGGANDEASAIIVFIAPMSWPGLTGLVSSAPQPRQNL